MSRQFEIVTNRELVKEYEIISQLLMIWSLSKSKKCKSELKEFYLGLADWCPCGIKSDSNDQKLENNLQGGAKFLRLKLQRPCHSNDSSVQGEKSAKECNGSLDLM